MSKFTQNGPNSGQEDKLRSLAKKLREETNRKQRADEFFGYKDLKTDNHGFTKGMLH